MAIKGTLKQHRNMRIEAEEMEIGGVSVPAPANIATLSGSQTITGAKTFSTMPAIPVAVVAATGNNQATAAAIGTGFTHVTAANATKAVRLPAAAAGLVVIIKNADAANAVLPVFPATGDAINALSANASYDMAAKTSMLLVAIDATTWFTLPLLAS